MLRLICTLLTIAALTGCATSASQKEMSISINDLPAQVSSELKGQVNIGNVNGGKDTNPLWISQVDNQGFKSALEISLDVLGYKSQNGSIAKYQVDALLVSLDQPVLGLSFDVKSSVLYTVISGNTQQTFPIIAVGTATISDEFFGYERMRIANERSIKENIKQFLQIFSSQFSK